MADIRDMVKEDRGIIKKIQAFLPGYKKYRNCEDLRSADNFLRIELAKKLHVVEANLTTAREDLARKMDLDNITLLGEVANRAHALTEKVKHAEQGYSPWISGDIRIEEEEIKALYDFDLAMFTGAEALISKSRALTDMTAGSGGNVREMVKSLQNQIVDYDRSFSDRIAKVTKVAQER
jgi:hypothetical protein